jgi:alkyl hydroperoxide reductase subunit AhpC
MTCDSLSCASLSCTQAIQYVAEHGEVCPANWKPGEKTMVADPDKSQDYFSTLKVRAFLKAVVKA